MKKKTHVIAKFGNRVKELRQKMRLSQEEFAERCDLDRTYISSIERGKRNVSLVNIEVIAVALKMTVSELTQGITETE
jgi:transcriptional regulator with XRE-family HTH domain